jgi:hypothetical protein
MIGDWPERKELVLISADITPRGEDNRISTVIGVEPIGKHLPIFGRLAYTSDRVYTGRELHVSSDPLSLAMTNHIGPLAHAPSRVYVSRLSSPMISVERRRCVRGQTGTHLWESVQGTSGKSKIASSASGCARRTRRFGRNLRKPDAARHGTLRPDEERHGICLPDEECQGIFLPDTAGSSRRSYTIWTQPCLPDAAMSSGCSRGYWTQPWLLNAAVASGRSAWLLVVARGFLTCGPTLHIGGIAVMVAA